MTRLRRHTRRRMVRQWIPTRSVWTQVMGMTPQVRVARLDAFSQHIAKTDLRKYVA